MSEYKGNGAPRTTGQNYVPGQGRPTRPANGAARSAAYNPGAQSRPVSSGARPAAQMPRGASAGTRYAPSAGGQSRPAPSGQPRPASARPVQAGQPRPASARPAQPRPAARPQPRRKKASPFASFLNSLFGGNGGGPQYGRMLIIVCALVLLMFGIVKGIGALTRDESPDYIVATKITEAPPVEPTEAPVVLTDVPTYEETYGQTDTPVEVPADVPAAEPTPMPVSDEGYFPETDPTIAPAEPTAQPVVPSGQPRTARLRFAGDIVADTPILDAAYNSKMGKHNFSNFFDLIRDQLANADYTSLNVDGSMGGAKHDKYGRYTGYPQFNTPPTLLYALQGAGVDMLSLANNHCLDGWFDGLLDTIKNCDAVGMDHVGAFSSQEDFDTPEIIEINGIRVGFLNYTQSFNSMDTRGVDPNALIWGVRRTRNADYEGDIQKLRDGGAEVVIVIMHWGEEYLFTPDQNQVSMANRIAAAGADVIVGGHPHVFQAAGWKKTTLADGTEHKCLIVYSLGNFLSKHRNEDKARTDAGIIFEFTLQENPQTGKIEVVDPAYLPIAVWRVGSEGAYDYRVVSVDAVLENRPSGMNDSAYARIRQISDEMDEVYGKSNFTRLAY